LLFDGSANLQLGAVHFLILLAIQPAVRLQYVWAWANGEEGVASGAAARAGRTWIVAAV
jgi:hypothetical protein